MHDLALGSRIQGRSRVSGLWCPALPQKSQIIATTIDIDISIDIDSPTKELLQVHLEPLAKLARDMGCYGRIEMLLAMIQNARLAQKL